MSRKSPPEDQRRDFGNALVRAGIAALVPAGGAINELLDLVIKPSIDDRHGRWLEGFDYDLSKLQVRLASFSLEDLRKRDDFISSFIQASRAAAATHQEEKRKALRNALLNIAISDAPDDDAQGTFISIIESYTTWHIRFLHLFDDPFADATARGKESIFGELSGGQMYQIIHAVFPELRGDIEIQERFAHDLERDHLIRGNGIRETLSIQNLRKPRTTKFGRKFLQFISTPAPLLEVD